MSGRERFLGFDHGAAEGVAADAAGPELIAKPDELSWWDWTVFLLHTAAEIEHALMVQYLYAAYSLASGSFTGTSVPAGAAASTAKWRGVITGIAREEMGHLLTEQNLLRFIGAPLDLEREDLPFRSTLYPFPLSLRPLTKTSLATYVAAEMPEHPTDPLIGEIIARATQGEGGMSVNRVGTLFATLVDIFSDPARLTDADLHPQTLPDQAGAGAWHGSDQVLVLTIADRDAAVDALRKIGEQGEGPTNPQPGEPPSHFDRFLAVYRDFPETEGDGEPEWQPTLSVPTDPSTDPAVASDAAVERNRITDPTTRRWAQLFDVRYRMLLLDLAHALHLSGPFADAAGTATLRGRLADDAFTQMHGPSFSSGLKGIAKVLTARPLKQVPQAGDPAHAGPPFELPYTLAVADDEHGRWRAHLALLDSSAALVAALRAAGETSPMLDEFDGVGGVDATWRAFVEEQLAVPDTSRVTVLLVRHADIPAAGGDPDPPLSAAGQARAAALADVAGPAGVTAVIVSSFLRAQQTAAPVAAALAITPTTLTTAPEVLAAIGAMDAGSTVLVVGHSDTVPAVVSGLGGPAVTIAASEFDHLFLLTCGRLTHLHYGA